MEVQPKKVIDILGQRDYALTSYYVTTENILLMVFPEGYKIAYNFTDQNYVFSNTVNGYIISRGEIAIDEEDLKRMLGYGEWVIV